MRQRETMLSGQAKYQTIIRFYNHCMLLFFQHRHTCLHLLGGTHHIIWNNFFYIFLTFGSSLFVFEYAWWINASMYLHVWCGTDFAMRIILLRKLKNNVYRKKIRDEKTRGNFICLLTRNGDLNLKKHTKSCRHQGRKHLRRHPRKKRQQPRGDASLWVRWSSSANLRWKRAAKVVQQRHLLPLWKGFPYLLQL